MPTISCAEFQQLLENQVEMSGKVDSGTPDMHLTTCPDCRALWEQQQLLDQAIGVWQKQTPGIDLIESVLSRMAFERGRNQGEFDGRSRVNGRSITSSAKSSPAFPNTTNTDDWRRSKSRGMSSSRQAPLLLAVMTMAMLLVVGSLLNVRFDDDMPSPENVRVTSVESPLGSTEMNEDDLEGVWRNAGNAYLLLAQGTAEAVVDATVLVAPTDQFASNDLNPEESDGELSDWGDRWRGELKPIGKEFGEALEFLFEAVPGEPLPAT